MVDRRSILHAAIAMPAVAVGLFGKTTILAAATADELRKQIEEARAAALAAFPYERVKVSGDAALQEWERLRREGRGTPVLIGDDEALGFVVESFHPSVVSRADALSPHEILSRADRLSHPESLLVLDEIEKQQYEEHLQENPRLAEQWESIEERLGGFDFVFGSEPPIGTWPTQPPDPAGLTVALDWRTGRPLDYVHIVLVPTDDWTTVPAYLRWGGWNANPPAECHVAALRSWRDRFGAELIGMGGDVLNIRVTNKPASRNEALALAREHYTYCPDTIVQGVGTFSNLAASLMAHDWWFFWWD